MSKADFEKAIDELLLKKGKSGLCPAGRVTAGPGFFYGTGGSVRHSEDDSAVVRFRLYFSPARADIEVRYDARQD